MFKKKRLGGGGDDDDDDHNPPLILSLVALISFSSSSPDSRLDKNLKPNVGSVLSCRNQKVMDQQTFIDLVKY